MKILRYTREDRKPHNTVVAIIMRGNKYLVQDHVKGNMLTFPIGKVQEDEDIELGLLRELKEEINIIPTKYSLVHDYSTVFGFSGVNTKVHLYLFKIDKYSGVIKNMEPNKCKSLLWMTKEELLKSNRKLGDATKVWLNL